jgi:hypothetical protein
VGVSVSGDAPFTYEWFKDGNPIPDTDSPVYSLSNIAEGDAGSYTVKITNAGGSVTSEAAVIAVNTLTN